MNPFPERAATAAGLEDHSRNDRLLLVEENANAAAADVEEMSTVVTNSSLGGATTLSVATTMTEEEDMDDALQRQRLQHSIISSKSGSLGLGAAMCPNRAAGQVCICDSCEAARTRLLHRANKTAATVPLSLQVSDDPPPARALAKRLRLDYESMGNATLLNTTASTTVSVAGSKIDPDAGGDRSQERLLAKMSEACKTILECIGEDPEREGLVKTPERWAKALLFLCHGYSMSPSDVTNGAVFSENHDEMVVVRNIDIHSLCEHHMVPFTGHVHIGYIPNGKILGLSKLARIAELYARRLQVQERLTRQIADAVLETIAPLGVAVVIECTHFCMVMRGVQKTGAITTTSSVRGCFETNPKTRAEFFSILHGGTKHC
jgi:GTP cyclohydrolase IA